MFIAIPIKTKNISENKSLLRNSHKSERWKAEHQCSAGKLISHAEECILQSVASRLIFPFINAKHNCNNFTTDHEEIDLAI